MKIYVSHPKVLDYQNELYVPLRNSALNTQYDFFLPHETGTRVNTKEEIQKSDLFLAEVSFSATGSGIEIGWADAFNVPVVCIYKKGSDISGSLKYVTNDFIEYESSEDLIKKLGEFLNK